MRIDILTLFPDMFSPLEQSMIGRAQSRGLASIRLWNIRDYATDRHRVVDDTPYGGGHGMVLKPEPIVAAVEAAAQDDSQAVDHVVLLTPQGVPFTQQKAERLAAKQRVMLVCGHYEGFDERVRTLVATDEISIGDYVLTGGELAAMVVTDAIVRLVPGVLGAEEGALDDSFATGLLEYPQYTRPASFMGLDVPDVLVSGHHENIRRWRREQALRRTWERRPDMLQHAPLTEEDRAFLAHLERQADQ